MYSIRKKLTKFLHYCWVILKRFTYNRPMNQVGNLLANIFSLSAVGALIGTCVYYLDKAKTGGYLATVFLGILGSLLGGLLANSLFGVSDFGLSLESVLIGTLGALLILVVQTLVFSGEEDNEFEREYDQMPALRQTSRFSVAYSDLVPIRHQIMKKSKQLGIKPKSKKSIKSTKKH